MSEIIRGHLYLSDLFYAADHAGEYDHIVNLTGDTIDYRSRGPHVLEVPIDDDPDQSVLSLLGPVTKYVHHAVSGGRRCLIHCKAGVSRSSTFTIAYLMRYRDMSLADAYEHVKNCRPIICPNDGFMRELMDWEYHLFHKYPSPRGNSA